MNMAKAQISTPQGIQVRIEGTPAEITAVLHDLERKSAIRKEPARRRRNAKTERASIVDLMDSLIDAGFFKRPRDLASVKGALAEMGHHYPVTTLSPVMLRQVRRKHLRRVREQKRWFYVN